MSNKSDLEYLLEALIEAKDSLQCVVARAIELRKQDLAKSVQNTHATGSEGASLASSPQSDLSGQAASLGPQPKGGGDVPRYTVAQLIKLRAYGSEVYVGADDYDALLAERDAARAALRWMCDKFGGEMEDGPYDPPPPDIEPLIRAALARVGKQP